MDFTKLLLTIPAITASVEFLKTQGVKGRYSQLAAVLIGISFSLIVMLSMYSQNLTQISLAIFLNNLVEGFLYGLCAAGFYDFAAGNLKTKQKGRHAYES